MVEVALIDSPALCTCSTADCPYNWAAPLRDRIVDELLGVPRHWRRHAADGLSLAAAVTATFWGAELLFFALDRAPRGAGPASDLPTQPARPGYGLATQPARSGHRFATQPAGPAGEARCPPGTRPPWPAPTDRAWRTRGRGRFRLGALQFLDH